MAHLVLTTLLLPFRPFRRAGEAKDVLSKYLIFLERRVLEDRWNLWIRAGKRALASLVVSWRPRANGNGSPGRQSMPPKKSQLPLRQLLLYRALLLGSLPHKQKLRILISFIMSHSQNFKSVTLVFFYVHWRISLYILEKKSTLEDVHWGPGPSTNSWLHFNVRRGERLSNQFRGDVWSASRVPNRCCFLDRDYCYKWIAIQIPHNAE